MYLSVNATRYGDDPEKAEKGSQKESTITKYFDPE